jgi:3',5'-cyclic-nucleotide phosphodiesterase
MRKQGVCCLKPEVSSFKRVRRTGEKALTMSTTRLRPGLAALVVLASLFAFCTPSGATFSVVVLGCEGGLAEGNLSSYLVTTPAMKGTYLALDAGTILGGLRCAVRRKSLADCQPPAGSQVSHEGWVLREGIKGYLISHAHADHVAGLVLDSTDDSSKPLVGLDSTCDYLRDHMFNWKTWPNFANEGERPMGKYRYQRVLPGQKGELAGLSYQAFLLSHSHGYPSTAFLLNTKQGSLLYCGDTGPDEVEGQPRLRELWRAVAPLVRQKQLRGVFLECSFPDGRKPEELYGHLTPEWMMKELAALAHEVDPANPGQAIKGLKVVVTHIKPSLEGPNPKDLIAKQLAERNHLGVTFIYPEQGQRLEF